MKEYTKRIKLGPCRIDKVDLFKLVKLARETCPTSNGKEDLKVYTSLANVTIGENSIEDFLNHEELPDRFDDLSIQVIERNVREEIDRSVTLVFAPYGNTLYVSGAEEAWVLGKAEQIAGYLRRKRPWFWFLSDVFPFIGGLVSGLAAVALAYFIRGGEILYSVSTAFLLVAVTFGLVFHSRHRFFTYTQIVLTPKKSLVNKENIVLIIGILSLIVAIVGLFQ